MRSTGAYPEHGAVFRLKACDRPLIGCALTGDHIGRRLSTVHRQEPNQRRLGRQFARHGSYRLVDRGKVVMKWRLRGPVCPASAVWWDGHRRRASPVTNTDRRQAP